MKRPIRKSTRTPLWCIVVLSGIMMVGIWTGSASSEDGVNSPGRKISNSDDDLAVQDIVCGSAQDSKICRLGICVRRVNPTELQRFGVSLQPGLVVTVIKPESPLADAGIEPKDILLEIEGEPLDGPETLSRMVRLVGSESRVYIISAVDHRRGRIGFLHFTLTGNRRCDEGRP